MGRYADGNRFLTDTQVRWTAHFIFMVVKCNGLLDKPYSKQLPVHRQANICIYAVIQASRSCQSLPSPAQRIVAWRALQSVEMRSRRVDHFRQALLPVDLRLPAKILLDGR